MDIDIIALYALAAIGPILVFATQYVVKGRTRDMTRLWFIAFFSYMVYYWLAKSYNFFADDTRDIVYGFALLWPIPAILAFWIAEKLTEKGTPMLFFKWMVYFIVAVFFSILLDGAAGIMHWYTYSQAEKVSSFINPIGGMQVPALMPFLMGILMMGVFFLVFNVHAQIRKRRIDETSATLLLAALSVVMGGALWVATNFILEFIKSML